MWSDSKQQFKRDPVALLHEWLLNYSADMAFSNHPFRSYIGDEVAEIIKMGLVQNGSLLHAQQEEYRALGMTGHTGLVDGALIIRDHCKASSWLLSCMWWQEYMRYKPRDQPCLLGALFKAGFRAAVASNDFVWLNKHSKKVRWALTYDFESEALAARIHAFPRCQFESSFALHGHVKRHGEP